MKLIAVFALLGLFQATPSVPRKATNPAEANEKPPASPSSTPDTNNTPANIGDGQTQNPSVSQPYVRISQIYGVPVKENGIDWRLWVFNGLLVIVGGFQVWLLYRTLGAIKRQAGTMERQTKATEDAAEAAKVNALALINSERAWIDGELVKETFPAIRYRLKITNHGKTPARMIGFEIDCGCLSEGTEFSRERLGNRQSGKLHFLLGADKSRLLEEVEPLNMHVIFGGCMGAGAYCVTVRYADIVVEGQKARDRETSFVYYCRFLLDSLERISEYDKYT